MWQRILTVSVVALFSILGFVLSFYLLALPIAIISCVFILCGLGITLYFSRPSEAKSKSLGATAISTIAALTGTNPLWAKMLAMKVPDASHYLPFIPQDSLGVLRDVELGFIFTTVLGLIAVVVIVWISKNDATISGQKPGNVADEIGEIGFKEKLARMAQVLETRLTSLDDETNWTDQAFTPLDAEIEKVSITGGRPRKIVDLITAIRRDHSSTGFLILGDPGSGKSVAMRRLAREMLKEVPKTQILPIYVNLKEWTESHKLSSREPADIWDFVSHYLKATGNDLIVAFCDQYLKRLLEVGRLFIIFDSFDEIPVLLDQDESSQAISSVSKNIEEFMIGPHKSRCVIASRYFRRPHFLSTKVSILEILPMSDRKIRDILVKSNRLSSEDIDNFFRSRNQWISYAKNPFVASLVVSYIAAHEGELPQSKIQVYEDYIGTRLGRLSSVLQKYDLSVLEVSRFAILISYEMFSRDAVGLEADLDSARAWMEEKYKLNWTRSAIDVLVRARLVRCSPYPDQRISFVHRRFNEYFLALAAQENLMSVDLESIANDRRDRDALVLYVELADDAEAARILRFCWNEIREREAESTSVDTVGNRDDNNKIRATYCLRFLVDGFASSKRRLVEKIGGEFCALLSDAVANHHSNMLRAKIAVEAAGILPDWEASEVIFRALQSGNYWIMETAIRSARNVQNISAQSLGLIRRQFWKMSEAEIFRKRRDFVDLFRLNPSFRSLSLIINLRTLAAFCQWPLRVSAILVFPVLYLISITAILGLTFYLVFVGIATDDIIERRKKGSSNRSRARKVWSIITWMMRVDTVFVVAFGLYLLFRIINLFIVFPGPEFGTSVLFRHMPPYDSPIALAMIGGCVSVNMWASLMRMLVRVHVVGQRVREVVCFVIERARRLTIKELAIGAGVLIGLGIIEAAFFYLTSKYSIVGWCVGGVVTIGFIWFVANALRTFFSEWVYVDRLPVTKLETRRSIAEIFIGLRSSYLRGRLVNKVEEYHRRYGSRPKDIWPQGAAPNLGDRASIRLSQLDAVWAGLER